MSIQIHACNIIPPVSGGGGGSAAAPYLLNGPDTSGLLINSVDVTDEPAATQPILFAASVVPVGNPARTVVPLGIGYLPAGFGQNGDTVAMVAALKDDAGSQRPAVRLVATTENAVAATFDASLTLEVGSGNGAKVQGNTIQLLGQSNVLPGGPAGIFTTDENVIVAANRAYLAPVVGATAELLARVFGNVAGAAKASLIVNVNDGATDAESRLDLSKNNFATGAELNAKQCDALSFEPVGNTANIFLDEPGGGPYAKALQLRVNNSTGPGWEISPNGDLTALSGLPQQLGITDVRKGAATGEVVTFEQVLNQSLASTPSALPGSNTTQTGALRTQTIEVDATNVATTYKFAVTQKMRLIGCRAALPLAGADTLALTVRRTSSGVDLMTIAAKAAPGGTIVPFATTYTTAEATFGLNEEYEVDVTSSGANFRAFIFLEFAPEL